MNKNLVDPYIFLSNKFEIFLQRFQLIHLLKQTLTTQRPSCLVIILLWFISKGNFGCGVITVTTSYCKTWFEVSYDVDKQTSSVRAMNHW